MAAEADASAHPESGAPGPAIDRVRDVAKWLIIAFGGIGASLVAGSQLSDIGKLEDWWRVGLAALGMVMGLTGVAVAIKRAVDVMTPSHLTLAGLAKAGDESPAAKLVEEEPEILLGHGQTIAELKIRRDDALKAEREAWAAFETKPDDQALEKTFREAEAHRKRVDEAVQQFLPMAHFATVKTQMRAATRGMFLGAALAALGIALFAWAAHPKTPDPEATAAVPVDPSAVVVSLTADGRKTLREQLGADCDASRLNAIALDGDPAALDVVTVPQSGCDTLRFTLTTDLGSVVSTESVPTLPPACPRENPTPPCVLR